MVKVEICVGSSCFLKGSDDVVEVFRNIVEQKHLESKIVLSGRFCSGKCNRNGVTVHVDDDVFTGITKEGAESFFASNVLTRI